MSAMVIFGGHVSVWGTNAQHALRINAVTIFTARCYASAVLAMGLCLCLSVSASVTSRCSIETAERIELVFGM